MKTEPFRFKQFHIHHHLCAHKVGTDGVLLGAWAAHPNPKNILDIGSGSGLLSLMLAQRFSKALFTGVEIHKESYQQAQQNLNESPFKERGAFVYTNFLHWETDQKFDLIVSNPPFFKKAKNTTNSARDSARRQFNLTHKNLANKALESLSKNGKMAFVLPVDEANALEHFFSDTLFLERKTLVKSFPTGKAIRHLLQFSNKPEPPQINELIIRSKDNNWHQNYKELCKEFYL